jgi:hypothetical protein
MYRFLLSAPARATVQIVQNVRKRERNVTFEQFEHFEHVQKERKRRSVTRQDAHASGSWRSLHNPRVHLPVATRPSVAVSSQRL